MSQGLGGHNVSDYSGHDTSSLLDDADSISSSAGSSRDVTPVTSFSQRASKKLKIRVRRDKFIVMVEDGSERERTSTFLSVWPDQDETQNRYSNQQHSVSFK